MQNHVYVGKIAGQNIRCHPRTGKHFDAGIGRVPAMGKAASERSCLPVIVTGRACTCVPHKSAWKTRRSAVAPGHGFERLGRTPWRSGVPWIEYDRYRRTETREGERYVGMGKGGKQTRTIPPRRSLRRNRMSSWRAARCQCPICRQMRRLLAPGRAREFAPSGSRIGPRVRRRQAPHRGSAAGAASNHGNSSHSNRAHFVITMLAGCDHR